MEVKVTDEQRAEIHKLLDVYIDTLFELKPRPDKTVDTKTIAKAQEAQERFYDALFNI